MTEPSDIDLLLIGKTGNGRSATGNSILRREAFISRSSSSSVTTKVAYEVSEFNGRAIKVVDGPGVGDTRMDNQEAVNLVMSEMEDSIAANPRGYHAFLLVGRFGGRFTAEDQDTIAFLKKVFGKDFVKDYCILVLTCGDNFEHVSRKTGQTFEQWCQKETGVFSEFMRECGHRVILFDNATEDKKKKCVQLEKLIQMIDGLRFRGHRYTDDNFSVAKEARAKHMIGAKNPIIHEETMTETSLIIQKFQELQLQEELNKKIKHLQDLHKRAESLHEIIVSKNCGTCALHDLCKTVKSLKGTVEEELRFFHRIKKERERIKREEERTRQIFEEKMRKQKEELKERFREELLAEEERRKNEMKLDKARREEEEKRLAKEERRKTEMKLEKARHEEEEEKSPENKIQRNLTIEEIKEIVKNMALPFRKFIM